MTKRKFPLQWSFDLFNVFKCVFLITGIILVYKCQSITKIFIFQFLYITIHWSKAGYLLSNDAEWFELSELYRLVEGLKDSPAELSTAGSQITLLSSTFCYNIDEGENNLFLVGPLSVWSLHVLPMPVWLFPRFLPHPKDVRVRWMVCLHRPRLSDVGGCEALSWKGLLSRVGPAWHPVLPREALATATLN